MAERGEAPVALELARASVRAAAGGGRQVAMRALGSLILVLGEAAGALIIVTSFGRLGGWTPSEVMWLIGISQVGLGSAMLLGDALEPPTFSNLIRDGRLDAALTRPMSPLLWVISTDVQIRETGRIAGGLTVSVAAFVTSHASFTATTVPVAVLSAACCAAIVFSLLVIGAAITMYTIEGTELLNAFTYGGATLTGFPLQIYAPSLRVVFLWLIPLALAVYVPALHVLGLEGPAGAPASLLALAPVSAAVFAAFARWTWGRGLHHYNGTGS